MLYSSALAAHFGVGAGQHHTGAAGLGALGKGIDHREMRDIACVAAIRGRHMLQGVEVVAPGVRHAARVVEVVFIHLFDIGRIAAEEKGVAQIG